MVEKFFEIFINAILWFLTGIFNALLNTLVGQVIIGIFVLGFIGQVFLGWEIISFLQRDKDNND